MTNTRFITTMALLAAGALSTPAAFAQGTWSMSGGCQIGTTYGTEAASKTCTGSGGAISATVSMYANSGTGGAFVQGVLSNQGTSGVGGRSTTETATSPDHAFDNMTPGGSQQFMLIDFGSAKVNLSAMQIGWFGSNDADISIYRWDGNAVNVGGTSLASAWSLVSSMDVDQSGVNCGGDCRTFNVGGTGATVNTTAGTNKYSSWWLISTYVGGAGANGLDAHNGDAFKILSFTAGACVGGTITGGSSGNTGTTAGQYNNNGSTCNTTPGGAPEPGSLALAGLALVGVFAARRRPVTTLRAA